MSRIGLSAFAVLACAVILCAASCETTTTEKPKVDAATIAAEPVHELDVSLDPAARSITATDRISFKAPDDSATLYLSPGLIIDSAVANGSANAEIATVKLGESEIATIKFPTKKGAANVVEIVYHGEISDSSAAGSVDSGVISEDGIYLSGRNWYPFGIADYFRFSMKVRVPKPFRTVAQGEFVGGTEIENWNETEWKGPYATSSLSVSAGDYSVDSKIFGEVTVFTYFTAGHADKSGAFLDKAGEYIAKFAEMLGPFPLKRYTLVENFLPFAASMPGYAVLESATIADVLLGENDLGREIVRSWWGNYVFFKDGAGDWREGLAAYCSDYMWKELTGRTDEAKEFLRDRIVDYNTRVTPQNAYPARRFGSKATQIDEEVGRTRPMMLFHQLRQLLGDEDFWPVLKGIVADFGGREATWDDFRVAFDEKTREDVGSFFKQWLDRTDLPEISLVSAKPKAHDEVILKLAQHGAKAYSLSVPVIVATDDGTSQISVKLPAGKSNIEVSLRQKSTIRSLEVDPGFSVFRRVPREDIAASLAQTLGDENLIIVMPTKATKDAYESYSVIAAKLTGIRPDAVVKTNGDLTYEEIKASSLLVFGDFTDNEAISRLRFAKYLPAGFAFTTDGFEYKGERKRDKLAAWMFSLKHPGFAARSMTCFAGNSAEAVTKAADTLLGCRKESHFYFKDGKVSDSGFFTDPVKPMKFVLSK